MNDITPEELRLLGGFGTSIVGRALLRSADTIERLQKLANEETHDAESYFEENKRQSARIAELERQVELIHGKYPESWALSLLDIATKRCGYEGVEAAPPSCAVDARLDELEQKVAALREDAERLEYMRTSGVVLVIHDVPYRGRELDAPIDAARNKEG